MSIWDYTRGVPRALVKAINPLNIDYRSRLFGQIYKRATEATPDLGGLKHILTTDSYRIAKAQAAAPQPPTVEAASGGNDLPIDQLYQTYRPTGSTGYGEPVAPEYVDINVNGEIRRYNLADPNDRIRFFEDKIMVLNQMKEEALAEAGGVYDQNVTEIDQEIADTQRAARNYVEAYQKGLEEFTNDYELGNVRRGQFFAGLSPNAFQSSQGTSAQYGQKKYIKGVGEMAKGAQEAVGADYLANPENFAALGENTTYGRAIGKLQQEKARLGQQFQSYADQLNRDIQNQAASTSTELSAFSPFSISRAQSAIPQVGQTDLSAYTPYTQFKGADPKTTVMPKVYTGNAFTPEFSLDAFLGRTKMNKNQQDLLRNYLLGK